MTKSIQSGFLPTLARMFLVLALFAAPLSRSALSQALPAAEASPISTGFAVPTSLGSLQYAVSASQSLVWGYYGNQGAAAMTNLTGDIAYLSNSKQDPFSMVLSGGHSFSESGQAAYSYVNLGFSQVLNLGRWNIILSDNVSYLPGTPTAGLSGVPGVGDLGVNPVQISGATGQGVLTNFSDRVANTAALSLQRQLTGKTSINASGAYSIQRFVDENQGAANLSSPGLDNTSYTGSGGFSHQIDPRNTYGANYTYSKIEYTGNDFGIATPNFSSQTASAVYTHQFTRKLGMSLAAGPQWTKTSTSTSGTATSVFVDASTTYTAKSFGSSLSFTRSANSGFGALPGSISDSASFSINRGFALVWNVSGSSSFTHTSTLPASGVVNYSVNTAVEGLQISRAIARNLSGYASYTFEDQSTSGSNFGALNVFSGISQVLGFGITYSPSSLHLGRP